MLALIRKWLLLLLVVLIGAFLAIKALQYRVARQQFPPGTTLGQVDVSGLTSQQASDRLLRAFGQPLYMFHRDEHVELNPANVSFAVDVDGMLAEANRQIAGRDQRLAFISFALDRPLQPIHVPLQATHDEEALRSVIASTAEFLDEPARPPQMLMAVGPRPDGEPGFVTDIEASLAPVEAALYSLNERTAELVVVDQGAPEMSLEVLKSSIEAELQSFDGMGSVFIMDLQTGEEVGINADVAMSGLSLLKIAIFVEAYSALDETTWP
ncbi:MAG: hypothetical protein ACRDHL_07745 [Candidatus Promineifilaceae bacterium]